MGKRTGIGWCDSTFNGWGICTPVSPGCDNCYADALLNGWLGKGWGAGVPRIRYGEKTWNEPLVWNETPFYQCDACGARFGTRLVTPVCKNCLSTNVAAARRRVFSASMSDWLDNEAPIEWLVDLLNLIRVTPTLDWLLLTKRIGNWRKRLEAAQNLCDVRMCMSGGETYAIARAVYFWLDAWLNGAPPDNVWLGATIVNREEMLRDGPKLKATHARIHFWSMEPLLGDLGVIPPDLMPDWGIGGGESGKGEAIRPSRPDWYRSQRDQFAAAGKPWLFKQWGEYLPADQFTPELNALDPEHGRWSWLDLADNGEWVQFLDPDDDSVFRVGKKLAGNNLDGRQHMEWPA